MDISVFTAFVAISTAVIVIPGPSVLLIISNSLRFGTRDGLLTAVGISSAMIVQLTVAIAGITSLAVLFADWFGVVRWIGILYLCYLGVTRLRAGATPDKKAPERSTRRGAGLAQGFLVALTNPTTLTFFVAFFPQFLLEDRPPASQFAIMSVTFWLLAAFLDVGYALLAARLGKTLQNAKWLRLRNQLSGAIMLAAAVGLALAR